MGTIEENIRGELREMSRAGERKGKGSIPFFSLRIGRDSCPKFNVGK